VPRPRNTGPTYIPHTKSGRGRLQWYDAIGIRHEKLLPGLFGSPESLAAKARLELELATSPTGSLSANDLISVAEVLVAFLDHAERYYVDADGVQTKEVRVLKYAIKPVRDLYAERPAVEFGPLALKAVRQKLIDAQLCRTLINRRIDAVKRVFKWAASEELVPVSVYEALRTLPGLRKGRSTAREAEPVGPVDDATVDATLPHLPHHVRVMIELMRYTGMRPAEVCSMSLNQIERATVWAYFPKRHKTAYHGKRRVVPFGPNARAVLSAFLAGRVLEPDEPIFSPRRAREERFAEMRTKRVSKVQPSQADRKKSKPRRGPTDCYVPTAISHAVAVACDRAFPAPAPLGQRDDETAAAWKARLTDEQKAQLAEWQREHRWHPYQLRHAFATRVRKQHGLEAAQVLLGHSRADVTQVYAERNEALAVATANKIG
jgi:site-specific recombinase XerD